MANLKFYPCNPVAITYTATSTNSNYPLSNLKLFYESDMWMSANNNNMQQLLIDYILPEKTYAIIRNSNIPEIIDNDGVVKLQSAANAGFTVSLVTHNNWVMGGSLFSELTTFPTNVRRYWRILFEDTAGFIPRVGNFWVGKEVDLLAWNAYPYTPGNYVYNTSKGVALDGKVRTSQTYGGHRHWELTMQNIDLASKNIFKSLFASVRGDMTPLYFTDVDSALFLVRFSEGTDPLTVSAVNLASGQILLESIEVL